MVGGQALDLAAETAGRALAQDEILTLQAMKTGALLRFAVDAGAILGRPTPQGSCGVALWLGARRGLSGRRRYSGRGRRHRGARQARRQGRRTRQGDACRLLGLDAARARRDALVEEAIAALDETGLGAATETLKEAARFVAWRNN